jgi:hypothetical protein
MDSKLEVDDEGLFSKRSSSNILSDPRILQHLRIVAQEAHQERVTELPENDETDRENQQRELYDKITAYNKRNQLGAFKILAREVCCFCYSLLLGLKITKGQSTGGLISNSLLIGD